MPSREDCASDSPDVEMKNKLATRASAKILRNDNGEFHGAAFAPVHRPRLEISLGSFRSHFEIAIPIGVAANPTPHGAQESSTKLSPLANQSRLDRVEHKTEGLVEILRAVRLKKPAGPAPGVLFDEGSCAHFGPYRLHGLARL